MKYTVKLWIAGSVCLGVFILTPSAAVAQPIAIRQVFPPVNLTPKAGWPVASHANSDAGVTFHDLDHDGVVEVLASNGIVLPNRGLAHVQARDLAGNRLWSVPATTSNAIAVTTYQAPTGLKSMVAFDNDTAVGVEFHLVDGNGNSLPGWPIAVNDTVNTRFFVNTAPVLHDLDSDGTPEVLFSLSKSNQNDEVIAYSLNGTQFNATPMTVNNVNMIMAAPSVADVNVAGQPNKMITLVLNNTLYAWDRDGNALAGFPLNIGGNPVSTFKNGPAVISYQGAAIILQPVVDNQRIGNFLLMGKIERVLNNGVQLSPIYLDFISNPQSLDGLQLISTPALGDLNGDGFPEIVVTALFMFETAPFTFSFPFKVFAFDLLGNPLPGFVRGKEVSNSIGQTQFGASPVLADVDGRPGAEIVVMSDTLQSTRREGELIILNNRGKIYLKQRLNLWRIGKTTPAVGKDQNNKTMISVTTGNFGPFAPTGNIYLWTTNKAFRAQDAHWPMYKRDAPNTGGI